MLHYLPTLTTRTPSFLLPLILPRILAIGYEAKVHFLAYAASRHRNAECARAGRQWVYKLNMSALQACVMYGAKGETKSGSKRQRRGEMRSGKALDEGSSLKMAIPLAVLCNESEYVCDILHAVFWTFSCWAFETLESKGTLFFCVTKQASE